MVRLFTISLEHGWSKRFPLGVLSIFHSSKTISDQNEAKQPEDENITKTYDELYDQLLLELDRLDEIILENHDESQYGEMDSSAD